MACLAIRFAMLVSVVSAFSIVGCGDAEKPVPAMGSDDTPAAAGDGGGARTVEVGCAMCLYKQEGLTACTTACKIDGRVVLLDGVGTDSTVLMAAGMCENPLHAEMKGSMKGDRFVAFSFKLKGMEEVHKSLDAAKTGLEDAAKSLLKTN